MRSLFLNLIDPFSSVSLQSFARVQLIIFVICRFDDKASSRQGEHNSQFGQYEALSDAIAGSVFEGSPMCEAVMVSLISVRIRFKGLSGRKQRHLLRLS